MDPGSDAAYNLGVVKGIVDHGWIFTNSNVGAPFGQEGYDFAATFGDFYHIVELRVMTIFSSNPAVLVNVFYVSGFALIAMSAHLVLRSLKFPIIVCIVGGLLYTALPYHFLRNESHLFLAAYWGVPLGAWLTFGVLGHARIFENRRDGPGLRRYLTWINARTIACCAVVAGASIYYAIFAALILLVAAIAAAVMQGRLRGAVPGVMLAVLVLGFISVYTAPATIYRLEHGKNNVAGQRLPIESEIYGLVASQMLLPPPQDRISAITGPAKTYATGAPIQSEGTSPALGLLLSGSFLVGVGACLFGWRSRRRVGARASLVRDSGLAALIAFLLGTVGGGSTLIAYIVTPSVRGWNRISVVIAFYCVVVLAAGLEALRRKARARSRVSSNRLAVVAIAAVAMFGLWEQTSDAYIPPYAQAATNWNTIGAVVGQVEKQLPRNSAVLQLPYVPFPENPPVARMTDYDHLRPYIQSVGLRWSYGATKGRPTDWMAQQRDLPVDQLLRAASVSGFSAVWIDNFGFADGGNAIEATAKRIIGAAPIASGDGREMVYPLLGLRARIMKSIAPSRQTAVKYALLHPVVPQYGPGFTGLVDSGTERYVWVQNVATLTLKTQGPAPRNIVAQFTLRAPDTPGRISTKMVLPGGKTIHVAADRNGTPVTVRFVIRGGAGLLNFSTVPVNAARIQIVNPSFADASIVDLPSR